MKQLLIILAFILPAIVKSQDTIKIPVPAARQIAKDLATCDSIKAVHELTKEQLTLTKNKVVLKDSIISNYVRKEDIYKQVITNQEQKFELQGQWVNELRKQNKTLKVKLTFTRIISILFTGFITYIYIRK
jgi:CRISPR/Cas system CMR subunit Cmr4 (Cas7 group RAMP superfamily)